MGDLVVKAAVTAGGRLLTDKDQNRAHQVKENGTEEVGLVNVHGHEDYTGMCARYRLR